MPKKTFAILGWTQLEPGDVVVRKGTSFGVEVEREVPIDVRVGDILTYEWDESITREMFGPVTEVKDTYIYDKTGAYLRRDNTTLEVYRKVED